MTETLGKPMSVTEKSPARQHEPSVASNATYAMFGKALYLASRLCIPPIVLAHISLAEYGIWSACFILIMYIGLTDVGFSNVYVRYTAKYHAHEDIDSINKLVSTGVFTLLGMAIFVLSAVWLALPAVLGFLKIDPVNRHVASILVMGVSSMFMLDLSLGAYCYLLHGLQRIREEQKIAISGYLLELVLIVLFLYAGYGVYSLLIAFVLRYTLTLSSFFRIAHRLLPGLEVRPHHFSREMLRLFFGFGLKIQASAMVGTALFSIDRVLAGMLVGPAGIAMFDLGGKLPVSVLTIPSMISNVTMPAASRLSTEGNHEAVRRLYIQATRSICLISAFPLGFLCFFSFPIVNAWLGHREGIQTIGWIMALSAFWSHLHISTGPGSAVFRSVGKVSNEFVYHGLRVLGLLLGVSAAILLLGPGIFPLALGIACGSALAALAYLAINEYTLGHSCRNLIGQVIAPGLLAYPVGAFLLVLWKFVAPAEGGRLEMGLWIGFFGVVYSVLLMLIYWKLVFSGEERSHLAAYANRILSRFPGSSKR